MRRAKAAAVALCLCFLAGVVSAQREQFANNAVSTLAVGIAAGDTSISLAAGTGALFPAITASDFFFYATIAEGSTIEIVKVTARSTDTLTVTRAQQGTSAAAFTTAATIQQRITASTLQGLRDLTSGFFNIAGPTAARTYTFPNASTTVLTTNAAVTEAQGGTNQTTYTQGDTLYASAANTLSKLGKGTAGQFYKQGATIPAWADASGVYPASCGSAAGWSPANATTYYAGRYAIFDCSNSAASGYAIQHIKVPFAMDLIYVTARTIIAPTSGTAGSVQYFFRKNDTTNTNTGTASWTTGGDSTFSVANGDFAAVSLSAGDTFAFGMTTPTWATKPAFVYVAFEAGFVIR